MSHLPEHLLRPALAVIWHEYARRLGRGDQPSSLTLSKLTLEQQQAIADLLGKDRLPGDKMRLPIARLLTVCKVDSAAQLLPVVEKVAGPIIDRRLQRQQQQNLKTLLWQWLEDGLLQLPNIAPAMAHDWVEEQRGKGVSHQRLDEYRQRYERMLKILAKLPANGVSLAVLAADVLGDPHALDHDTALGRLCVDAYCALHQLPRNRTSRNSRRQWGWAGVSLDGVSSMVLTLGLHQCQDAKMTAWLHHMADSHEPVQLTYRQIMRWPITALAVDQTAVIVENPSIVEAVADAGINQVPVICSAGQPTVAVQQLVQQLAANGAKILQHADFDAAGMHITRWFKTHAATTPWKMTAQEYLTAVQSIGASAESITPAAMLAIDSQKIPDTPWDLELCKAMKSHGVYVSEEQVRGDLLRGIGRLGR